MTEQLPELAEVGAEQEQSRLARVGAAVLRAAEWMGRAYVPQYLLTPEYGEASEPVSLEPVIFEPEEDKPGRIARAVSRVSEAYPPLEGEHSIGVPTGLGVVVSAIPKQKSGEAPEAPKGRPPVAETEDEGEDDEDEDGIKKKRFGLGPRLRRLIPRRK